MDQLQKIVGAIILTSVVIILADAAADNDVSFLGLKTATSGAYGVAAFALVMANFMLSQLFLRVSDLTKLADPQEAPKVRAIVFNHNWPFNPFSYFGSRPVAVMHTSFGMGVLIFVWFLGLTALALLWDRMDSTRNGWDHGLWYGYVAAGFTQLVAIASTNYSLHTRLAELASASDREGVDVIGKEWHRVLLVRYGVALLFAMVGYWIFYQFTHVGM
jgi:hypothetical protein